MLQMHELLCKFDCDDLYREVLHLNMYTIIIVCFRDHWEKYIFIEQEKYAQNNVQPGQKYLALQDSEWYGSIAQYSTCRQCTLKMPDAT